MRWQAAMPCAGHTAGGDSIASARMSRSGLHSGAYGKKMKRLRTLLGIGLGLAVVAGAGWYISQTGTNPPARQGGRFAAGAATPVGIATAAKGEIPIVVRALGTV